ncbi:hypothetical protein MMC10_000695 [Thelotrema lepadinum]|nr:hypothetical protein [Thelotrema lepadinum]
MEPVELITNQPGRTLLDVLKLDMSQERSLQSVDIICAYIQKTGVQKLWEVFEDLQERNVPVRVLTTMIMGISEPDAIRRLASLSNVKVKVSWACDNSGFSFHAKGWRFHGSSEDLSGAIIGSSNMSRSALEDGIEWNVRVVGTKALLDTFDATFNDYFNDRHASLVLKEFTQGDFDALKQDRQTARANVAGICECSNCSEHNATIRKNRIATLREKRVESTKRKGSDINQMPKILNEEFLSGSLDEEEDEDDNDDNDDIAIFQQPSGPNRAITQPTNFVNERVLQQQLQGAAQSCYEELERENGRHLRKAEIRKKPRFREALNSLFNLEKCTNKLRQEDAYYSNWTSSAWCHLVEVIGSAIWNLRVKMLDTYWLENIFALHSEKQRSRLKQRIDSACHSGAEILSQIVHGGYYRPLDLTLTKTMFVIQTAFWANLAADPRIGSSSLRSNARGLVAHALADGLGKLDEWNEGIHHLEKDLVPLAMTERKELEELVMFLILASVLQPQPIEIIKRTYEKQCREWLQGAKEHEIYGDWLGEHYPYDF